MKKLSLIILTILVIITQGFAQSGNKKWVAGVSSGVSVPYAEFAEKYMHASAGFASSGANIEVDFFRYAGKFFAFSSNLGYANIFFNETAYKSGFDSIPYLDGKTTVDAGNYQVLKGLLGLSIKIPESQHFEVLFVFQLGFSMSVHPELSVTNSEWGVINSVKKDAAWSIISYAGLKINYYLSDKYGISLNYCRNSTNPSFDDDTSPEGFFTLPVKYQNINIGFVINL